MGANTEARRAPALEEEDAGFAAAAREGKSPERSKSADFLSSAGPSRALEPRAPFVAAHGLRGGTQAAELGHPQHQLQMPKAGAREQAVEQDRASRHKRCLYVVL